MEVGDKLRELNMTEDELHRLSKAFKDEKFREMLRDYAQELSDPENKKRYEEEIQLLEQERGNTIEFIHPEPFRSLRTSVNGKNKCFINICVSNKVGKPKCKFGVSEEGRRGQCWSLPHSLHPGRQDTDKKGNTIMIYDVIFHPDTLHIASKNKRFMDMVESTALQGIQSAFKVTLDKNNVRQMSTKYKGTPQPCVIRKPIPGFKPKEPSEKPDPLAFPYPDEKQPTKHTEPPGTKNTDAEPKSFQIHPRKEPTRPKYTVKYRSVIDLQDFRCSRDSAQSPRPKEIVVTVDMPLLKVATDASLEVKDTRLLLLESKKPAYRLELPLAYPVNEDEGEAKFNKQSRQLVITLPVLPSDEALDFAIEAGKASVSDDDRQEERRDVEEEDREGLKSEEKEEANKARDMQEEEQKQQIRVEKGEEKEERIEGRGEEEAVVGEEEKLRKQKQEGENGMEEEETGVEKEEKGKMHERKEQESVQEGEKRDDEGISKHDKSREDGCDRAAEKQDMVDQCTGVFAEEENSENQPVLITHEHLSSYGKEAEVNRNSSALKTETSDVKHENDRLSGKEKVETDVFPRHTSGEESQTSAAVESRETPAVDVNESGTGGSGSGVELTAASVEQQREGVDEDDPLTARRDNKPPPGLLREVDEDGNETVISDHSTSAGFTFQNTMMYELD